MRFSGPWSVVVPVHTISTVYHCGRFSYNQFRVLLLWPSYRLNLQALLSYDFQITSSSKEKEHA